MSDPLEGGNVDPLSFAGRCCRVWRCRPAGFERRVLRRCFPAWSQPLGAVLLMLFPGWFERELGVVRRVGVLSDEDGIRAELDGYLWDNQRDQPFRVRVLGLRLSRRRFMRLYRRVIDAGEAPK